MWNMITPLLAILLSGFELVSVNSSEQQANWVSSRSAISADGRYVVFDSIATNLVPRDSNGWSDVFVRDRVSGTTERASLTYLGGQMASGGLNGSEHLGISLNGQAVLFESDSSNLVANDGNGFRDVFVRRRDLATTACVSVTALGAPGNYGGGYSSISDNGRYVAFYSSSTNLTAEASTGIFVRDLEQGTTRFVSSGGPPSMSPGGRYVSFVYFEVGSVADIYRWDGRTGAKALVSEGVGGAAANGDSFDNSVSADGRYVAFSSAATNLVAGDAQDSLWGVYVRDMQAGTTTRADALGAQGGAPKISPDGRYAAWTVPSIAGAEVWVRDLQQGLPAQLATGIPGRFSSDGSVLSFSAEEAMVGSDTNGMRDVFVWLQ